MMTKNKPVRVGLVCMQCSFSGRFGRDIFLSMMLMMFPRSYKYVNPLYVYVSMSPCYQTSFPLSAIFEPVRPVCPFSTCIRIVEAR